MCEEYLVVALADRVLQIEFCGQRAVTYLIVLVNLVLASIGVAYKYVAWSAAGANEHTKVMYPLLDPAWSLGIFDFSATALLPNEDAPFNFFEPRYKAMAMDAIENHNGWFILRGAVPTQFDDGLESASVLCRIHEHVETPEGNNIFVKVIHNLNSTIDYVS